MKLELSQQSALQLSLSGSIGSFKVSGGVGGAKNESLEVKFFLTHVSLDFEAGNTSAILDYLAPVREIYDTESLEFDEIMQRDLDDARVSSELIPYLLDPSSRDLVKIFPPIVVVVLPTQPGSARPADLYPTVTRIAEQKATNGSHNVEITRSGDIGAEVFEFENPIQNGKSNEHDLARLKLNPQSTKLVIVDGQHRAMALLALYRNLRREWDVNSRRVPYRDYYAEWTEEYIRKFRLDKLSMPVMFCTFPDLNASYKGDYDLKKAARAIFLALNKNAKKVSDSRNRLLDDNDLIAVFLRETLSAIKSETKSHLRIWNIELDQTHDKMKIESPIAISGVNHIYYMIEHSILSDLGDLRGLSVRRRNLWKQVKLNTTAALERLDGRNKLGVNLANSVTRNSFNLKISGILSEAFMSRFGLVILTFLKRFKPYEWHAAATLSLKKQLEVEHLRLKSILFDGQGIYGVFQQHLANLKKNYDANVYSHSEAEIKTLIERLSLENAAVERTKTELLSSRANKFIHNLKDKSNFFKIDEPIPADIRSFVDRLYMNVLSTVAFQTALVSTFIGLFEQQYGLNFWDDKEIDLQGELDNYLSSIEKLFAPTSTSAFRHLVAVFEGRLDKQDEIWKIAPSNNTFRKVVYPEEMKPDQWPKYRYLLLELWQPLAVQLRDARDREVDKCRHQVMHVHMSRTRDEYLRSEQKFEDTLTAEDTRLIFEMAVSSYRELLKHIGVPANELPEARFKAWLKLDADESQEQDDLDSEDV